MYLWTDILDQTWYNEFQPGFFENSLRFRRQQLLAVEKYAYEQLGRRYEQIIRGHENITQSILRQFVEDYRGR